MDNDDDREPQICIGLAMREMRKERRLSQEDVGMLSGLHPTYISDIERGRRNPGWGALDALLTAFKVSLSDFGMAYDRLRFQRGGWDFEHE